MKQLLLADVVKGYKLISALNEMAADAAQVFSVKRMESDSSIAAYLMAPSALTAMIAAVDPLAAKPPVVDYFEVKTELAALRMPELLHIVQGKFVENIQNQNRDNDQPKTPADRKIFEEGTIPVGIVENTTVTSNAVVVAHPVDADSDVGVEDIGGPLPGVAIIDALLGEIAATAPDTTPVFVAYSSMRYGVVQILFRGSVAGVMLDSTLYQFLIDNQI